MAKSELFIIKNSLILFAAMMAMAVFSFAQGGMQPVKDTASVKKKLAVLNETINTIDSDFEQEKYLGVMSDKIISKGHFCFKKENKLRWEYSEPYEYLIVIDGEKMYIRDDGKVSKYDMESNKMFREINKMMMGMIRGDLVNSKEFKISYFENEKYYSVVLVPAMKGMSEFLVSITIMVSKTDLSVDEIVMKESFEDYTKIRFTGKKLNCTIPDERFDIK